MPQQPEGMTVTLKYSSRLRIRTVGSIEVSAFYGNARADRWHALRR